MGIPMSFILGLFLRIFQFISFYLRFFTYFLRKSPQSLEERMLAPVFHVGPHIITSGLLDRDGSNLVKIVSEISKNGGDL